MKIRIFFIGIKSEGTRFSPVIAASHLFQRAERSLEFCSDITRHLEKANERESVCDNFREAAEGIIMRDENGKSLLTNGIHIFDSPKISIAY